MMHSPNERMSVRELTWGVIVATAAEVVVFDGTSAAHACASRDQNSSAISKNRERRLRLGCWVLSTGYRSWREVSVCYDRC